MSEKTVFPAVVAIFTVLIGIASADDTESSQDRRAEWVIVIHGGAGSSPSDFTREENEVRYAGIESALRLGVQQLKGGRSALDTVEVVIRHLEDNPSFNAGKGAVFTAEGRHELDASIMDGSSLSCGAVAGVATVKNPIRLARLVMTDSKHVLLSGGGAEAFAESVGVDRVSNEYFDTPYQRSRFEAYKARNAQDRPRNGAYFGTVGCVVLDADGNIAAGTSTGGLTGKRFGRIGDSPIIGAGTYADNATCGVSCTGIGEHFIRHSVAYDLSARLKYGNQELRMAADDVMENTLKPGWGGLIAIDAKGHVATAFNTKGMASGIADSTGRFQVQWKVEDSRKPH